MSSLFSELCQVKACRGVREPAGGSSAVSGLVCRFRARYGPKCDASVVARRELFGRYGVPPTGTCALGHRAARRRIRAGVHRLDEAMSFVAHEFLANAEFGGAIAPVEAPVAEREDDRQCLDAGLGEAVASPCAACRVFTAQDGGSDELLEPVGQDVGRDAFD